MRTLAATHPQQLFWLLLSSQCHLSVAWRNDNSSGSRTRSLLFQCDLSPTWRYMEVIREVMKGRQKGDES